MQHSSCSRMERINRLAAVLLYVPTSCMAPKVLVDRPTTRGMVDGSPLENRRSYSGTNCHILPPKCNSCPSDSRIGFSETEAMVLDYARKNKMLSLFAGACSVQHLNMQHNGISFLRNTGPRLLAAIGAGKLCCRNLDQFSFDWNQPNWYK